jgi:MinD-like ATPase involved in chromosome partitioning or flagellar assembly
MTESNWQGDMLRRMSAEQSPGEEPDHTDNPAAPAPADAQPVAPPAPPQQEQQPPVQQPEYVQPPPPYQQPQYPPQQPYYPPQPQGPPPYQPGPYDQQYAPPPYQPAPQEQYPPPYEQYPPYEQQQAPYYPPEHQRHPGQAQYQPQQPPYPPTPDAGWGPPPTPQSDQIGTPLPPEQEGESVFRRFRKIASEAAYLVGASGRIQHDVDNIATIRRPIAIMRRIGVLSPVTNAGTSTVTALLSTMLTAQRSDRVVVVDADPSGAELSRRLELSLGAGPLEGVSLVRSDGNAEAIRTTLAEVQGQGSRDVGLALVDCPGTMYDEISTEMASSAHCTVLVVPSVQHVAEYCLAQLDQLTPAGQDVLLSRGVVVISLVQNVDPRSVGWLASAFRQRGLEPVLLPYDAHIAQSWPLYSEQLQAETRRAVLDLAARVVETVTRAAS